MANSDDPSSGRTRRELRPRPGAGSADVRRAGRAAERRRRVGPTPRRFPTRCARTARHRIESARAGGESAAAARRRRCARRCRRWTSPGLRRHALEEIRRFEEQARAAGVPSEVVLSARYTLCAGLDEAVLSTPWGNQSEWAQHPLLVALHREAWGGEKFFEMLDRISQDPARYIDLMELQYLCLAFGFAGKYQVQERGQEQLPRGPAASSIARSASYRGQADAGAVAALARAGGSAQSADAATSRGGSSARPRCRSWPSRSPSTTRASPATRPIRCTRRSRRSASRTFRRAAGRCRCAGRR